MEEDQLLRNERTGRTDLLGRQSWGTKGHLGGRRIMSLSLQGEKKLLEWCSRDSNNRSDDGYSEKKFCTGMENNRRSVI